MQPNTLMKNKQGFLGIIGWIIILVIVLAVVVGGTFYLNIDKGNVELGAGKIKFNIDYNNSDTNTDTSDDSENQDDVDEISILDRVLGDQTNKTNSTDPNNTIIIGE